MPHAAPTYVHLRPREDLPRAQDVLRCRHKFFNLTMASEVTRYTMESSHYMRGCPARVKDPRRLPAALCKSNSLGGAVQQDTYPMCMQHSGRVSKSPSSIRSRRGKSMHPPLTQRADSRQRRCTMHAPTLRLFVPDPRPDIALF